MSSLSKGPLARSWPRVLAVFMLAAVFLGAYAWRTSRMTPQAAYAAPPVMVAAETVRLSELRQTLDAVGSLSAVNQVTIAAEVAARVVAIGFESGADVAEGAELVHLFDAPERADLAAAKAKAEFARLQLDRAQSLEPKGAETRAMREQRVAELDAAEAQMQQTEARLVQRSIRAPFAGRLGVRRVNLGQYVNAGDALVTLTALDRLYVNFTLPQQELSKLAAGGAVSVETDARPAREFKALINAVEPVVASDTRNVFVQATLENRDGALRPGLYVTAKVALPPRPDAILVPATAIVTGPSGDVAYVVRDGKAAIAPVEVGARFGAKVAVERGLAAGDVVITEGQLRVRPGAPVTIAEAEARN